MSIESLHAIIRGRVQGVGFRYFALTRARDLALQGFVQNLADGSVEVYAEGERSDLDAYVAQLREGPPHANVESLTTTYGSATGDTDSFTIR